MFNRKPVQCWQNRANVVIIPGSNKFLPVFYIDYAFHKFLNFGMFHRAVKIYRAMYHQHNSES